MRHSSGCETRPELELKDFSVANFIPIHEGQSIPSSICTNSHQPTATAEQLTPDSFKSNETLTPLLFAPNNSVPTSAGFENRNFNQTQPFERAKTDISVLDSHIGHQAALPSFPALQSSSSASSGQTQRAPYSVSVIQPQNCTTQGVNGTTTNSMDKNRYSLRRSFMRTGFVFFFLIFLVVGLALTVLGFLDYGSGGPTTKAFRILGVVALILCIGFLIAACVFLSDCMTSALSYSGEEYDYEALRPSYTSSFHSQLTADRSLAGVPWVPELNQHMIRSSQSASSGQFRPHPCPSCSCNQFPQSVSHQGLIQFPEQNSTSGSQIRQTEESNLEDFEVENLMELKEIKTSREFDYGNKEWV